jgi:DNA-binding LacI/PurR family transcriptional regulator
MVTMTDVAQYAHVSKMTVSRVLSGNGYVKEETRRAVEQAISVLGYRPNLLAKGLVTGRTNLIVYLMPDICDPFFGNICKGIADTCYEQGYTSIVCNADSPESLDNFIDMVIDRKAEGAIFHHLCVTQAQIDRLLENQVTCVLIDNEYELQQVINIQNDNYLGARSAVNYLYEHGYRKIACIQGCLQEDEPLPPDYSHVESYQKRIWQDRTRGFLDALHDRGLEPFAFYTGRGSAPMDVGFTCGQRIVRRILEQSERPDAIYCQSDVIALGVLGELLESRVSVPEKIALIGHDGIDFCRYLFPRITTIVQPQRELGILAAGLLIKVSRGRAEIKNMLLPSALFEGDTTN